MAPIAVTPPLEQDTSSELTARGIQRSLAKTAPSLLKSNCTTSPLTSNITQGTPPVPETSKDKLDASLLQTTLTTSPRPVPALNSPERASQKVCTDHMIQAKWTSTSGWHAPTLQPYGPLSLMPTASCLHYATQCFEGMKLYRGFDGKLRLFRPDLNCNRMVNSALRIALPDFSPEELLKLVSKLCATDGPKWLPKSEPGSFLYIRPSMIASDSALGVQKPKEALLFIILTCFPTMDDNPGGMRLLASEDNICRAWPGGFGHAKVGANYGPTLEAQGEAKDQGYHQILWLFGEECVVTEAGASNFFVVWRTREGVLQLVTAGLEEKIVLDGVTRKSVLGLARERLAEGLEGLEGLEVVERKFTMGEIEEAVDEGRLVEAFATGTAFFVSPVGHLKFRGRKLEIPMATEQGGRYMSVLKGWLKGIMWGMEGMEEHPWGYVVDEE